MMTDDEKLAAITKLHEAMVLVQEVMRVTDGRMNLVLGPITDLLANAGDLLDPTTA